MYPASQPGSKRHTLSVLVENRPGVLARIAGLFARRAFNINSLSVSPTERPDISRVAVWIRTPLWSANWCLSR